MPYTANQKYRPQRWLQELQVCQGIQSTPGLWRVFSFSAARFTFGFVGLSEWNHIVCDACTALQKGIDLLNEQGQKQGQQAIPFGLDHFYTSREGERGLRRLPGQASRALETTEKAQRNYDQKNRHGQDLRGVGEARLQAWKKAEEAFDRWDKPTKRGNKPNGRYP